MLGVDVDPSVRADFPFLQAVHHADQRRARPGELRSEWVTVLADGWGPGDAAVLLGFDGGAHHDGTLPPDARRTTGSRCGPRPSWATPSSPPGAHRPLHSVRDRRRPGHRGARRCSSGGPTGPAGSAGARTAAPFQVGWCSWYQYFHDVTEADIAANLALADRWPFDVFQVDDGYQAAIGDWLETNDRFPSDLAGLAASIGATGRTPGLWLAPFLVAPDSEVARRHPDWIARHVVDGVDTGPLRTWWNPPWGGGEDGFMYGLDTTHPEVAAHLEAVAAAVVDAGFPYLKLDFTFSPSVDGGYADPTAHAGRTGAGRVRRHPPGGGRRRLPPRVRRAPGQRGGPGRRQPDRPRRRPGVVARPRGRAGAPATWASNRPPPTPSPTRSPGPSCTGVCGSTIPTA